MEENLIKMFHSIKERKDLIDWFYNNECKEDDRLIKNRQGQLEYITTMNYIHKFLPDNASILELGAGTGRYSIALAKEGYEVSAVELIENNIKVLRENSKDIKNINSFLGDATDLSRFDDNTFDLTLSLGPMYHLYEKEEQLKAINEAIRVTKSSGVLMFAFLSIHAILMNNFLDGSWKLGKKENFTDDFKLKHFKEQLFTGFEVDEFESLFNNFNVEKITIVSTDGILETAQEKSDFQMSDEDFKDFVDYHLHFCERRELLGYSSHLLYICNKR